MATTNTKMKNSYDTALSFGKVPPQAVDAEKALLGAIMLERGGFETAISILDTEDCFYQPQHQYIYKAMKTLYLSGNVVDLLTMPDQLTKDNKLEAIGGPYYLVHLTQGVVNGAHIENHARIVKEKYLFREVIRVCGEHLTMAYNGTSDVFDLINSLSASVEKVGDITTAEYPTHISDILTEEVMHIHEMIENKVSFTGVPTGFEKLDKLTGGWQPTDLIILAARPAVGKTAFTMNLAVNAGKSKIGDFNVLFFSLEMSKRQIGKRSLSMMSGVELSKIYRDVLNLSPEEVRILERTAQDNTNCKFYVNDRAAITPLYIKRVANDLKRKVGVDIIIVDYLQLMNPTISERNRERDIASISRDLKGLAKELEIPVIALSQLNREGTGEPDLKHLRESGAIEQDADVVGFLYGLDEEGDNPRTILKLGKHRNGATDKLPFIFDKQFQRFSEPVAFPEMAMQFQPEPKPFIPDNPRAGMSQATEIHYQNNTGDESAPF